MRVLALLQSRSSIYILITLIFFVGRVILFAAQYGGIEHDSGWYLGVAKNLAHRGIYASYTNTISGEGEGAYSSIHGRFSVQDNKGFSYFPAGVTAGPGYIFPEAFFLKAFGNGFWQYRLWPLLAYTILLFSLFFIVWQIGGLLPLLIFQVWLWVVPQMTTIYAYESYSEPIALVYLLFSFFLICKGINCRKKYFWFLSGIFLAFSVLTKTLFLLPGLSLAIPFFYDLWTQRKSLKIVFLRWVYFFAGFSLPIVLFELYRYFYLTFHFGRSGWEAINQDILLHFRGNGSGTLSFNSFFTNWEFVQKKLAIWLDVGVNQSFLLWAVFLTSPLLLFSRIQKKHRMILALIYMAALISLAWFVFISPAGWARHAWQGLLLGMAIIALVFGLMFKGVAWGWKKIGLCLILIIALALSDIRYTSIEITPFLNQKTIEGWRANRYARGLEGFPHAPILSLNDQKGLIRFFQSYIQDQDRVYYAGWFIQAEASPLVDKVFYTLDRYFTLNQRNPDGGGSYVIFGPYQQGPWSFMPPDYLPRKVLQLCQTVVYANPSYTLCTLRTGLSYRNEAYN